MVDREMLVLFDLDSTLVSIEGLDWLAAKKGFGEQVKLLTEKSMNGDIPFKEAFFQKANILAPSVEDMHLLSKEYCQNLVPGVKDTLNALKKYGCKVGIVTSNFRQAVLPIAKLLGIRTELIYANDIIFDPKGAYLSMDINNPLADNGGKAKIVQKIKAESIVFVGDSVTDLDVKPFVELFIGFGGIVERPVVKQSADAYVTDKNMLSILPLLNIEKKPN